MKKTVTIIIAAVMLFTAASLTLSATEVNVPLQQPEPGEFSLILDGRTNGFAQRPAFTDNGDGTFSVVCLNGLGMPNDWYEDVANQQYTNQNGIVGDVDVTWNNYFPRVFYKDGVVAEELHWGIHEASSFSDALDMEVWCSDDSESWRKIENVTIVKYSPASSGTGYTQEFDKNYTPSLGLRFIFEEPVEAKWFFVYDPDPEYMNFFHCSPCFAAAVRAVPEDSEPEPVASDPMTDTKKPEGSAAPAESTSPAENGNGATTGLIIALAAAGAVIIALVVVIIVKSKKK